MKMMMRAITQVTWHAQRRDASGKTLSKMKTPGPDVLPGSNPQPSDK